MQTVADHGSVFKADMQSHLFLFYRAEGERDKVIPKFQCCLGSSSPPPEFTRFDFNNVKGPEISQCLELMGYNFKQKSFRRGKKDNCTVVIAFQSDLHFLHSLSTQHIPEHSRGGFGCKSISYNHLGPVQTSNFSCTEPNTYLGRPE